MLSTNGGRPGSASWPATANDGRAVVRIPRVKSRQARIMIPAVDNYFFDVNDRAFRIK